MLLSEAIQQDPVETLKSAYNSVKSIMSRIKENIEHSRRYDQRPIMSRSSYEGYLDDIREAVKEFENSDYESFQSDLAHICKNLQTYFKRETGGYDELENIIEKLGSHGAEYWKNYHQNLADSEKRREQNAIDKRNATERDKTIWASQRHAGQSVRSNMKFDEPGYSDHRVADRQIER